MGERLLLYCDGSVRWGARAGIGCVLVDAQSGFPIKRWGEALSFPATVNEAEYHALLRGLREALRLGATEVECYLDSELVRQQVLGKWTCNHEHLRRLRDEARALLQQFREWTLERIESEQNTLAHCYATVASTQNRRKFFWQHPRRRGEHTTHTEKEEHPMPTFVFTDYEPLPTGSYLVRVLDVQLKNGNYGEQLQFTLEIASGEHAGRQLKAWCNPSTSTNGKLYRWARALLGEPVDRLDTNRLIGKQALAQVVQQQASNGNIYSRVQELLPMRQARKTEPEDEDPFEED